MNNCPIEITDYESSLIAADWHEEQGQQHTADALRDMPPFMARATNEFYTGRGMSRSQAHPGSTYWLESWCRSRSGFHYRSQCGRKSGSSYHSGHITSKLYRWGSHCQSRSAKKFD